MEPNRCRSGTAPPATAAPSEDASPALTPDRPDVICLISRYSNAGKDMVDQTFKTIEGYYTGLGWALHPIFIDEGSGRVTGVRLPHNGSKSSGRVVFLGFPLDAIPMTGVQTANAA